MDMVSTQTCSLWDALASISDHLLAAFNASLQGVIGQLRLPARRPYLSQRDA